MKHRCVGGGHLVDPGTLATMVQEVSMITPTTRDGGNKGVIIAVSTLQNVPIFTKHDVKAMAQHVASNPVSTTWGLLIVVFEKACARPHVLEFCLGLYAQCTEYTLINVN
jgi:hypothetical protein